MLRRQRQAEGVLAGLLPFLLGVGWVVGEFGTEVSANFLGFLRILHLLDATEDDDALDIQRPLPFPPEASPLPFLATAGTLLLLGMPPEQLMALPTGGP